MFLSDASTKRPVAMTCLLIALVGLGLNSYRKLSLENLPSADVPYVSISTTWVGATPEDMETDVAKRIEDAVSSIDGLKHIQTTCLENICNILLEFNLDVDVDVAAVDVREKVDKILGDLPDDADRPVIEKIDINATSVVKLALTGDATLEEKYDYVDNSLADRFAMIPGVGSVEIIGGNGREVHVELDRRALVAAGLTTADVVGAIKANINSLPSGYIREKGTEVSVKFDAEYPEIDEISSFEVVSKDGVRRTLGDLGTVFMTTEEVRRRAKKKRMIAQRMMPLMMSLIVESTISWIVPASSVTTWRCMPPGRSSCIWADAERRHPAGNRPFGRHPRLQLDCRPGECLLLDGKDRRHPCRQEGRGGPPRRRPGPWT